MADIYHLTPATDGPRTVYVSINGATPLQLTFNGNNWYDPVPYVLPVQLRSGTNTIVFSNPNPTGYAPGIDCIIVRRVQVQIALGARSQAIGAAPPEPPLMFLSETYLHAIQRERPPPPRKQ